MLHKRRFESCHVLERQQRPRRWLVAVVLLCFALHLVEARGAHSLPEMLRGVPPDSFTVLARLSLLGMSKQVFSAILIQIPNYLFSKHCLIPYTLTH